MSLNFFVNCLLEDGGQALGNSGQNVPEIEIVVKLVCPLFLEGGEWGTWAQWSECSRTCRAGTQWRNRTCDNPTPRGGKECKGKADDYRTCITKQTCTGN